MSRGAVMLKPYSTATTMYCTTLCMNTIAPNRSAPSILNRNGNITKFKT